MTVIFTGAEANSPHIGQPISAQEDSTHTPRGVTAGVYSIQVMLSNAGDEPIMKCSAATNAYGSIHSMGQGLAVARHVEQWHVAGGLQNSNRVGIRC